MFLTIVLDILQQTRYLGWNSPFTPSYFTEKPIHFSLLDPKFLTL